eukprot:360102-Chlamydomonas_euryale.AAC.15
MRDRPRHRPPHHGHAQPVPGDAAIGVAGARQAAGDRGARADACAGGSACTCTYVWERGRGRRAGGCLGVGMRVCGMAMGAFLCGMVGADPAAATGAAPTARQTNINIMCRPARCLRFYPCKMP